MEIGNPMANFVVSNLQDSGAGSLRQAIIEANSRLGVDEVVFDSDVFGAIALSSGELRITDALNIAGPGADLLTIDAGFNSRVFNVDDEDPSSFIDVTIQGLTIAGGDAVDSSVGGGIFNRENFSIIDSTISNNRDLSSGFGFGITGGGIYNDGGTVTVENSQISGNSGNAIGGSYDASTVTVTNSTISGNSGSGIRDLNSTIEVANSTISGNSEVGIEGAYYDSTITVTNSTISGNGAGIFNYLGTITVTNSTISGNSFGGISSDSGLLTVSNSTISGNSGSGIDNYRPYGFTGSSGATITNSVIENNSRSGIENYASIAIIDSTISGNSNFRSGGGIDNSGGVVRLFRSTVSGNSSSIDGGAIDNNYGLLELVNSTVTGNFAQGNGGAVNNGYYGRIVLINSTIAGNSAANNSGGINNFDDQYGTRLSLSLSNSIVAGNAAPVSPDIRGNVNTNGFNILGDTAGASGFRDTDIVGVDINQVLDNLSDNGGPTLTLALVPGSPAINGGNNADVPPGVTTDQRGFDRIVDGTVDIGAFEVQSPLRPTPVPEPSVSLLGLVLIGIGCLLKRRDHH